MSNIEYTVNVLGHTFKFFEIGDIIYVDTTLVLSTENDIFPIWKQQIEEIQGVVRVGVCHKYKLSIHKGSCFKLQEIVDQIVNCLVENLGSNSPCLSSPVLTTVVTDTDASSTLDFFLKLAEIENREPLFKGVKIVTDDIDATRQASYQWQCTTNGTDWTDISDATSDTLPLTSSLVGKKVRVTASYTDNFGDNKFLTSLATASITSENITLKFLASRLVRGQYLAAVVIGINQTITYQWQSSSDGTDWTDISGGTCNTLLLTSPLVGIKVRVKAFYGHDFDVDKFLTSTATAPITHANIADSIALNYGDE